jgi:hypothetical protein
MASTTSGRRFVVLALVPLVAAIWAGRKEKKEAHRRESSRDEALRAMFAAAILL